MNNYMLRTLTCLLLFLPCLSHAVAMDQEGLYAEELKQRVKTGKLEQLDAGGKKFVAIFQEQTVKKTNGAVIILHDRMQHPDWREVINPVRSYLPLYGWSTLSIQAPLLELDKPIREYEKILDPASTRIISAIQYLKSRGVKRIILLGYGMGAIMAMDYLARASQNDISSVVTISMTSKPKIPRMDTTAVLQKLKLPVLDIVATLDRKDVIKAAELRYRIRDRFQNFRQIRIDAADHDYAEQGDILGKRILSWLSQLYSGWQTNINEQ